jgi:hypothetical protein
MKHLKKFNEGIFDIFSSEKRYENNVKRHVNNIVNQIEEKERWLKEGEGKKMILDPNWPITITYDGILNLFKQKKPGLYELQKLVSDIIYELEKIGYETQTDLQYGLRIEVTK